MTTGPKPRPINERFFEKVAKAPNGGCWNWIGQKSQLGYGRIMIGSRTDNSRRKVFAHRVSYELHFGKISDDLVVCHKCDNPGCVNPQHLFLGTQKDNMADAKEKGRVRKPENNTHCRNGHEYTPENTVALGEGRRACRRCRREAVRRHYWRNAEAKRERQRIYYHNRAADRRNR